MRRILLVLGVLLIAATPLAVAADATLPPWRRDLPEGRQQATIVVGETEVTVDLAISGPQQQLGLGYRNGLNHNHGMLFPGEIAQVKTFWMKGMRFCLDIIWIENGTIVGAAESVCPDPAGTLDRDRQVYSSEMPVTHVLEMDAGWLQDNGYGPGTIVDLNDVPGLTN